MHFQKKLISLVLSGAMVLGVAGAAMAAPAVSTGNVNIRSGPGTQYERVGVLARNQLVDVTGCRGGWCYIEQRGRDGWVSANYLQAERRQSSSRPSVNFSFSFGNVPEAPRPQRPQRPQRPDWNGGHHGGNNGGWNGHNGGWNGGWNDDRPRPRDWN